MSAAAAPCETTRLSPGQSLHTAVEAGTVLAVTEGRLRVDEAPQWLAERCIAVSRTLEAGEHHVVAQTGWLCVTALGLEQGACLRQWPVPQVAARRPVWRLMRRLIGV